MEICFTSIIDLAVFRFENETITLKGAMKTDGSGVVLTNLK